MGRRAMGTGSVFELKGRYVYQYRDHADKVHRHAEATKTAATKALAAALAADAAAAEHARLVAAGVAAAPTTLKGFIDEVYRPFYLEKKGADSPTYQRALPTLKQAADYAGLGDKMVGDISDLDVERFL